MSHPTINLLCVQFARLLLLIKRFTIVPLAGTRDWAILIDGRGFSALLQNEVLIAPNLIRGVGWSLPRPKTFPSRATARRYLTKAGLGKLS